MEVAANCIPTKLRAIYGVSLEQWFHIEKARGRQYPAETMTDADNIDNQPLYENTLTRIESLLHRLEQVAGGTVPHVNVNKTKFMHFKQKGAITTLRNNPLKLEDQFS